MSILAALRLAWTFRRIIGIAAAVLAALGLLWWLYSAVYDRGYDKANAEWEARQQAAQAQAQADSWAIVGKFGEIDTGITINMESINAVRTIFRDKIRTVAIAADRPDCAIADSLRGQINAAASAYAAAATGSGGPAVRPAKPAP